MPVFLRKSPKDTLPSHPRGTPPVVTRSPSLQGGVGGDPTLVSTLIPSSPTPSQVSPANLAWTFYIGEEKKVYHFLRDRIASKSPAIKVLMDEQADIGGPKEITLNHADVKKFDIYAHYVYHDCLPSSILDLENSELIDPQEDLLFLIRLYRSGLCIDDSTFANRVLDLINVVKSEHIITLNLILYCYGKPLLEKPRSLFTNRFVRQCVHESKNLRDYWFRDALPFNGAHVGVYYSICETFVEYHTSPARFPSLLQGAVFHHHKEGEVCYSEWCNEIRPKLLSSAHRYTPICSGGPGDA